MPPEFGAIACVDISALRAEEQTAGSRSQTQWCVSTFRNRLIERDGLEEVVGIETDEILEAYVRGSGPKPIDELRDEFDCDIDSVASVGGTHSSDGGMTAKTAEVVVGRDAVDRLFARAASVCETDGTGTRPIGRVREAYRQSRRAGTLSGPLARIVRRAVLVEWRVQAGESPGAVVNRERERLVGDLDETPQMVVLEAVHRTIEDVTQREVEQARQMLSTVDRLSPEQERTLEGFAISLADHLVTERIAWFLEQAGSNEMDECSENSDAQVTRMAESLDGIQQLFGPDKCDREYDPTLSKERASTPVEGRL
ncbi:hypothetical protein OB955_14450 [Halobacteria archaeon AArc-m2/3/4]|uniref:Uncharacterized protein n=1 Tax=Natronoglomus mannanivorans TaxID=2979990 RepID=A0ABT2QG81_9EURY|nr:hypothetical protein [Halobacteria archaeon AArc-m2/3/4]